MEAYTAHVPLYGDDEARKRLHDVPRTLGSGCGS